MGQYIFVEVKETFDVIVDDHIETWTDKNVTEWPVDTEEDIEIAKRKMIEAGMTSAVIYTDFGSEESYEATNMRLFV